MTISLCAILATDLTPPNICPNICYGEQFITGRQTAWNEGNVAGKAPHTIIVLVLSIYNWTTGSFTQVWQKQADKLNWSGALNRMRPIALTKRKCNQLQHKLKWMLWLCYNATKCQKYEVKVWWGGLDMERAKCNLLNSFERVVIRTSTIQIISRAKLDQFRIMWYCGEGKWNVEIECVWNYRYN